MGYQNYDCFVDDKEKLLLLSRYIADSARGKRKIKVQLTINGSLIHPNKWKEILRD